MLCSLCACLYFACVVYLMSMGVFGFRVTCVFYEYLGVFWNLRVLCILWACMLGCCVCPARDECVRFDFARVVCLCACVCVCVCLDIACDVYLMSVCACLDFAWVVYLISVCVCMCVWNLRVLCFMSVCD